MRYMPQLRFCLSLESKYIVLQLLTWATDSGEVGMIAVSHGTTPTAAPL